MDRRRAILTFVVSLALLVFASGGRATDLAGGLDAYCAKHLAEAFRILAPLAEKGSRDAQLIMGLRYFHGMDGKTDHRLARKWYARAAEQGDPEAQVKLGLMLAQGQGGKADVEEAVRWFRKAAEAGYSAAQYNLGFAYSSGQGVTQDNGAAMEWLTKAAEQGDGWAQANLGYLYMNAGQTGASKVVGYKWLLLSSADGDEEAKQLLERERPGMTADELSEAERLAGQFKPNPTATTESVTRRCRPDSAEASKKKSD